MTKFVCPGFTCKKCNFVGVTEVDVYGRDVEFKPGDKVSSSLVGKQDRFEGIFCPRCFKNKDFTIYGVTLRIEDGVYLGSVFD